MRKLVVEQIDIALETHPLHVKQHGFQRAKSTETAISKKKIRYTPGYW